MYKKTFKFLMVRHGESIWNSNSTFTGWSDIPLTTKGIQEAINMGAILKNNYIYPTKIFTSELSRAILTSNIIATYSSDEYINLESPIVIEKSWRLNEKHYGDLDGVRRQYLRDNFGDDYTKMLRNSYTMIPPTIQYKMKNTYPIYMNKYYKQNIKGESKEMIYNRVIPYWNNILLPEITGYNNKYSCSLICTHKHTARVIMKHVKNISDGDFEHYQLPEKKMLFITIDENGKFISEYLIDY